MANKHQLLKPVRIDTLTSYRNYALAGPGREVFLEPPDPARMAQSVVEMQFPVA